MPEQKTIEQAEEDLQEDKSPSTAAGDWPSGRTRFAQRPWRKTLQGKVRRIPHSNARDAGNPASWTVQK
jgi:hypothetical protein